MGDGSADSDNLDFPVRPGFEETFSSRILEYLKQERHQWDISELNTMPPESPVARLLANALERPRWTVFESFRYCSAVPLPNTWGEYLQKLSSEDKTNLARYERRLHKRYSVRIYRCTSEKEMLACLEALFRLHQSRWQRVGEAGTFASSARREFYAELSRRLLARKKLEMWVAELNGNIAAVQFAMRQRDKVYQLQEGYDPAHASDRIGFVLRGAVLKQMISEGVRVYDFLGGKDGYKARWGAQPGCYHDLYFARSLSWGGALLSCAQGTLNAKQWLRTRLPSSVWQVLHRIKLASANAGVQSLNESFKDRQA
jgi:CelD/BcsL family acetyltransferase involved in cellulose biosynthesis